MEFLEQEYFNNTVKDYIIAAGIILLGTLFIGIFRRIVLNKLTKWSQKTRSAVDDLVVGAIDRFGLPILGFLIIYWGVNYLELPEKARHVIEIATTVAIAFFVIRFISTIAKYSLHGYVRKQENGEEKVKQLTGIILIINIIIWGLGVVFLLDNLGYDVTAIIAGLGIGGIAIALAAQNILGDLFNYFVIFFDRPFEVGDFIVIDDKMGTVEYIGLKTTRLKSLSGEQLIIANSDLTNSRIHNYKRMERRRVVFTIGVTYNTSVEQLQEIPGIIRAAIEAQKDVTFDRSHFSAFKEYSLDFESVYFVLSADFNRYMDTHQSINIAIFKAFADKSIEFAYPTRTIYEWKLGNKEENATSDANFKPVN